MATKKITDLSVLSASDAAALDVLPIVDIDADETKKIHLSSLKSGSFSGSFQGDGSGLTGVGSTDTGSLMTTASVSLNTITFTKGDGTTFPITVDTGSGGGGGGTTIDTGSLQDTIITGSLTVSGSSITDFGNQTYNVGPDQTHRVLNADSTASVMFIVSGSGNVGVNKAQPTHQFHVSSSSDPVKIENLQSGGTLFVTADSTGVLKTSQTSSFVATSQTSSLTVLSASHAISASYAPGGGGTPGGSDTQVQFNAGGAFAGDPNFTFNKTPNSLKITGSLTVSASSDPVTFNGLQGGGTKFVTITDDGVLKNSDGLTVTLSGSMVLSGSLTVSGSTINNTGPFNQTGTSTLTGDTTFTGSVVTTGSSVIMFDNLGAEMVNSADYEFSINGNYEDGEGEAASIQVLKASCYNLNRGLLELGTGTAPTDLKLNNNSFLILHTDGHGPNFSGSLVPQDDNTWRLGATSGMGAANTKAFATASINFITGSRIDLTGPLTVDGATTLTSISASSHISTSGNILGDYLRAGSGVHIGPGPDGEKSTISVAGNNTQWTSELGNFILSPTNYVQFNTGITASSYISASGTVYGLTGSFTHLQGNSPITVGSPATFQQAITASGAITASQFIGQTQLLPFHTHSTAPSNLYLDPTLYPTNTTLQYQPASEGTGRIQLPHPHSCSVGYTLEIIMATGAELSQTEISASQGHDVNMLFGTIFGGANASGGTGPGMNKSFSNARGLKVVGDANMASRMKFTIWNEYTGGTPQITTQNWRGDLFMTDWSGSVVFSS